jgi:LCP family protein required for cell wall assembly
MTSPAEPPGVAVRPSCARAVYHYGIRPTPAFRADGSQEHVSSARASRHIGRIVLSVMSALILVATVVGAGVSVVMGQLQGNIKTVDVSDVLGSKPPTTSLTQVNETTGTVDPINIVLMGSDTREGKGNGGFGTATQIGGQRSDTVIVLHVAADRKSAIAVSIPRDTIVTLPVCKKDGKKVGGYKGRFNQAIELGGPGCTIKAVKEMSGLDIHNFMLVDFGGFKRIVDAVGGVEICLTSDVNDPLSGLKMTKGKHLVEGTEALAFVRTRHGLGDGSDTSRIRRQQAFLSSLLRKVLSSGTLLNPAELLGVLNAATSSLTADPQLADINNLKDLALSLKDLKPSHVTFTTLPWTPNGDNATVSVNTAQAKPIWDAMKNDTPWPPKGALANDQPLLKTAPNLIHVNVLNGTGVKGKGKEVAKELRKQGYLVEQVSNADTGDVAMTTVQYDPTYDQSAKTVIYAANAQASETKKKLGKTINLIVGADWAGVRPVTISDITKDYTANVNSADEAFCAS